jgi:inner membrane protein
LQSWHWVILSLILLIIEVVAAGGTLFFLFFSVGAIIIAVLIYLGFVTSYQTQFFIFPILSIFSYISFRFLAKFSNTSANKIMDRDSIIGQKAIVLEDIAPNSLGNVELRGAVWSAKNNRNFIVSKGELIKVKDLDGLTLILE